MSSDETRWVRFDANDRPKGRVSRERMLNPLPIPGDEPRPVTTKEDIEVTLALPENQALLRARRQRLSAAE